MANSQRTARTTINESEFGSGEGEEAAVAAWERQLALDDGEELTTPEAKGGDTSKKPAKKDADDGGEPESEDWGDDDLQEALEEDEEPEDGDPEDDEEESDESDEDDDEGPTDPLNIDPQAKVKIKVNGEETEVTYQELKDGYSRTQDYTQKTQALANERKALEQAQQDTVKQKQQWDAYLDQMGNAITTLLGQRTPEQWAELERTDRYTYLEERQKERALQERLSAVEAEKKTRQQEQQDQQQQEIQKVIAREQEALFAALPDWKTNQKVAEREWGLMKRYGQHLGFTEQELKSVIDHRQLLILRDAARLHALESKKASTGTRSKVRTKPAGQLNAGTPKGRGAAKVMKQRKSAQRLAKSGSTEAAADYFESLLDDE